MASYLSTQVNSHVEVIGLSMGLVTETFSIVMSATTGAGDTITLAQIPLNSTIVDMYFSLSATLGAAGTWNLGTTTTAAQFASASTSFQAAAELYMNALNGFVAGCIPSTRFTTQTTASLPAGLVLDPSGNVADYLVLARVAGGGATTATLKGWVRYTLNTAS